MQRPNEADPGHKSFSLQSYHQHHLGLDMSPVVPAWSPLESRANCAVSSNRLFIRRPTQGFPSKNQRPVQDTTTGTCRIKSTTKTGNDDDEKEEENQDDHHNHNHNHQSEQTQEAQEAQEQAAKTIRTTAKERITQEIFRSFDLAGSPSSVSGPQMLLPSRAI